MCLLANLLHYSAAVKPAPPGAVGPGPSVPNHPTPFAFTEGRPEGGVRHAQKAAEKERQAKPLPPLPEVPEAGARPSEALSDLPSGAAQAVARAGSADCAIGGLEARRLSFP